MVRILFALLILSGASALWLAGHRGDIGLYALAAVAGALAVLYGAEVFFGAAVAPEPARGRTQGRDAQRAVLGRQCAAAESG